MNIFITGINGFCGSHIVKYLLENGHSVTGVTRSQTSYAKIKNFYEDHKFTLLQGDLNTLDELPQNVDSIVHIAARSPTETSKVNDFVQDNILATERLVNLAKINNIKSFIFFSSISIYGDIEDLIVNEQTQIKNPGAYGASKLFGELFLKEACAELPSVALRLPGVIGKGAARHWLSNTINKAMKSENITIFNPQAPFNNAVYINDLCILLGNLLKQNLSGFTELTLGANGSLTIQSIIEKILLATHSNSKINTGKDLKHSFTISSNKAKQLFNYDPLDIDIMLEKYLEDIYAV